MIDHRELPCKWWNTYGKTIKTASLNGHSQERLLDCGDSGACDAPLALSALFWNPVHFWPGNEILTWPEKKKKNPSFEFQTITQMFMVLKDFAK